MPARDVPILPPDCFNALAICRHGPMLYNRNDQYVGASLRKYGEFSPGESWAFRTLLGAGATVVEAPVVGALAALVGVGGGQRRRAGALVRASRGQQAEHTRDHRRAHGGARLS